MAAQWGFQYEVGYRDADDVSPTHRTSVEDSLFCRFGYRRTVLDGIGTDLAIGDDSSVYFYAKSAIYRLPLL